MTLPLNLIRMTLTTKTPSIDAWSNDNSNDGQHAQNSKTVECQLGRTYEQLADTEANIELFNALINLDLATYDVKKFIVNQSNHKRVDVVPDLKVQRQAMRSKSKLHDAIAFSSKLRRKRDVLKSRISKKYKGAMCRRILDKLVKVYRDRKRSKIDANRSKIDHLKHKNQLEKALRTAPPWY